MPLAEPIASLDFLKGVRGLTYPLTNLKGPGRLKSASPQTRTPSNGSSFHGESGSGFTLSGDSYDLPQPDPRVNNAFPRRRPLGNCRIRVLPTKCSRKEAGVFDDFLDGERIELTVPIVLDDKGYLDRRCPSGQCGSGFKVHHDDWLEIVADEAAYCPICGHSQEAQYFSTPEQDQYLGDFAMQHVMGMVDDSMEGLARSFNSRQQAGFVSLSMTYERGAPQLVVPCEASDLLRQDIRCEKCACRFATIGAAYFCPACRHNSGVLEYNASVENIEKILVALDQLVDAMKAHADEDAAENLRRSLLENSMEDLATILQRRTETLFALLPNEAQFTRDDNLFQRLVDASALWERATGVSYKDIVDENEWQDLGTMMQRRHKVGHKLGHVDQRYVEKSGDAGYEVGQRLVIRKHDVKRYLACVKKLVGGLEKLL